MNECKKDVFYKTKAKAEDAAIVDYDFDCLEIKTPKGWMLERKQTFEELRERKLKIAEEVDESAIELNTIQEEAGETIIEVEQITKKWRQKTLTDGVIDLNQQLDPQSFPHLTESGKIKATIANLAHLFASYGIKCQYDEILKKQIVSLQTANDNDLSETSTFAQIKSLLALNNAPISCVDLIPSVMSQNVSNPIVDWITSSKWDKQHDYIGDLLKTLAVSPEDIDYKNKAVVTWLVQCVAAADSARSTPRDDAKAKFELVLVLQGGQGLKKTSWFQSLLPREMGQYVIDGAHLDPSDKDTVIKCISGWICELGELDATFRKADIARLKAFLSNQTDTIRLPYDRVSSNFKRRTSFCASVNPNDFLNDSTGARRFLPLAITNCDNQHGINVQQMWAQVWELYISGFQWWATTDLETMLESRHDKHSETSSISELINDKFDTTTTEKCVTAHHLSITRVLANCGITVPSNMQIKQAKDYLEKNGFRSVQATGIKGYWLNMK